MKSVCINFFSGNYYDAAIKCQRNRMRLFHINNEFTEAALNLNLKSMLKGTSLSYWIQGKENKMCGTMQKTEAFYEARFEPCNQTIPAFCEYHNEKPLPKLDYFAEYL
jgi:hypothetical protein